MSLPIEELTPRQIVAELDGYIVGQTAAKRAIAVALRNRYRRQQLPPDERDDILPKNLLMIGPTGVGKTELARRLAQMARAPFVKVEATKFTEVGYVGRDVESMVRDLAAAAVRLVEAEKLTQGRPAAEKRAVEQLVDLLDRAPAKKPARVAPDNPLIREALKVFGGVMQAEQGEADEADLDPEPEEADAKRRARLRREIKAGKHDSREVEIETEEAHNPFVQVFTPQGMEEMGLDFSASHPFGARRSERRVTVAEAREIFIDQEIRRTFDTAGLHREAVQRCEQTGIIFLDELDKIAGKQGGQGPDVSREGVQRDLLPIIEGSVVASKFGPVRTDHILFIAAGAFHMSKPSDLIPELQGRLPIRVELEALTEADFRKILDSPKNALVRQYEKLLGVEGVKLEFTREALDEVARMAADVNSRAENIGARRLHTLMEKLLEDVLFDAPEAAPERVRFDAEAVRSKLAGLVQDADLSRYIL